MNILALILIRHHCCFIFCLFFNRHFITYMVIASWHCWNYPELGTWTRGIDFGNILGVFSPYSFHLSFVRFLPLLVLFSCPTQLIRVSFVDKTERTLQRNLLVWFRQVPTFSWLARMATVWKTLFFQPAAWRRALSTLSLDVQRIPWELSLVSIST